MISLEALQAIDSIDRKGSFSAAAEELHRVPSALSYTIKKLEEQLNIKLFDRSKQRATLTPVGRVILEQGRDILQQVSRLEEQAKRIESGYETHLRIVVDTILPLEPLWPLLQSLQQQHPWLHIQLLEEALSGSWEALVNRRADLLIGATGDEPAGGYWHKELIVDVNMGLYCSPKHPAAQLAQPIKQQQLKDFTHIVVNDSAHNLPARNVGLLGLKQIFSVASIAQKVQALIHGLGISHLPTHLGANAVEQGQLKLLKTESKTFPQALYMAWPKECSGKSNKWLRDTIIHLAPFRIYQH